MRLSNALQQWHEKQEFEEKWIRLPFILRPERKGLELWRDVLSTKYSPSWTDQFEQRMKMQGSELGIQFDFGGHVGNSLESLRFIHWVSRHHPEHQEPLIRCLSRNHFERKLCVAEHTNLLAAAEEVQIPLEEAKEFLQSDQYRTEVQKQISRTSQYTCSIPVVQMYWEHCPDQCVEIQGAESQARINQYVEHVFDISSRA